MRVLKSDTGFDYKFTNITPIEFIYQNGYKIALHYSNGAYYAYEFQTGLEITRLWSICGASSDRAYSIKYIQRVVNSYGPDLRETLKNTYVITADRRKFNYIIDRLWLKRKK